jgi:hypothetical protein
MKRTNITLAQYTLGFDNATNGGIQAVIDNASMSVPLDPANRHYAEIMRQVEAGELVIQPAEGNEPLPADEPAGE